jgi:hypothetical protein
MKTNPTMKSAIPTIAAALFAAATLQAGTTPVATMTTAPEDSGWSFRFAPYAWLTTVDGDVGVGPLSAPVDISFSDTLDKVDMAYMFVAEIGYGKWTLGADFVYGDFGNDIDGGGKIFRSFRYEYTQWVLTPTLGYRVIENEGYRMDVFAGARINGFDTTLTGRFVGGGQIQRGGDTTWVDPIIGVRGQAELGGNFFLRYNADIGGFGVESDLLWSAFLGLGYHFNDSASVAIGYRGMGLDYASGATEVDLVSHGPVLGAEFRF